MTTKAMLHASRAVSDAISSWNDGHFAYGTLRLLDSSPTVWSFRLLDTSPTGHFAYETFCLLDSSPIGQFAYWTFRLLPGQFAYRLLFILPTKLPE